VKTIFKGAAVVIFVLLALGGCAAVLASLESGPGAAGVDPTLAPQQNSQTGPAEVRKKGAPKGVGPGTWEIGTDIKAGTYKTGGPAEGSYGVCYWARLSDVDGESIITNGLPQGPAVVRIKKGDAAFDTNGCKPWVRQ